MITALSHWKEKSQSREKKSRATHKSNHLNEKSSNENKTSLKIFILVQNKGSDGAGHSLSFSLPK